MTPAASIFARTGSKSTNHDLNRARAICLQRLVHAPVQLDLVIQRAQHVSNGPLFSEGRKREFEETNITRIESPHRCSCCIASSEGRKVWPSQQIIQEALINLRCCNHQMPQVMCKETPLTN